LWCGGNFFFVRNGRLCTSGSRTVLGGITRTTVLDLAEAAGVPIATGDFSLYDVYLADEAFLTATSFSILPVAQVNGKALRAAVPGPVTQKLLAKWSDLVGVDIVAQARRHLANQSTSTSIGKSSKRREAAR
jgi:branched-chain amino acid aminotransferase